MAEVSWTRKYRPENLDSYVGNANTKKKVESMFARGKVPQTILFAGDRGCGKTTLARIIAKSLVCRHPHKVTGMACETCESCTKLNEKFIATGEAVPGINVREIDITKMNTKEAAANLVEEMRGQSIGKKPRVYILDEIQRASKEAQNSYLKVAEEPGANLYIILCTTDPEDLIAPFKSRFSMIPIKRPSIDEVVERLRHICLEENTPFDEQALRLIVTNQNRVPRESISKLELVAIGGKVTYHETVEELQMVSVALYEEYLKLMGADVFMGFQFIEDLYEKHGVDHGEFLSGLANYLMDAFSMKLGIRLDKYTETDYKNARKITKRYTAKDLSRFMGLAEEAMKNKDNPRFALTMLTLRMGHPTYFELPKGEGAKAEAEAGADREARAGMNAYAKAKVDYKRKKEELADKVEDSGEDALMNMFEGTEIVDLGSVLDASELEGLLGGTREEAGTVSSIEDLDLENLGG